MLHSHDRERGRENKALVQTSSKIYYNKAYQDHNTYVLTSYLDNVVYILVFIPAVLVIEKAGIKIALIIGLILSISGCALALFVEAAAAEAIGQLIVDAGFPIIVSCGTKIPAKWFPFKERFIATSFAVLAGLIGYAMGDGS